MDWHIVSSWVGLALLCSAYVKTGDRWVMFATLAAAITLVSPSDLGIHL
jgi:hypothetical protein